MEKEEGKQIAEIFFEVFKFDKKMKQQFFDYINNIDKQISILTNENEIEAVIYFVLNENNKPITKSMFLEDADDILRSVGIIEMHHTRYFNSACKRLKKLLNFLPKQISENIYIDDFCKKLEIDGCIKDKTKEIVLKVKESGKFIGYSPISIISGSIYIASILCKKKIQKWRIGKHFNITEGTIGIAYKKILNEIC